MRPRGQLVGHKLAAFVHQLLERGEPDPVIAQAVVGGQRLARGPGHVEVPAAGGAHRQHQRERRRLPGLVE